MAQDRGETSPDEIENLILQTRNLIYNFYDFNCFALSTDEDSNEFLPDEELNDRDIACPNE